MAGGYGSNSRTYYSKAAPACTSNVVVVKFDYRWLSCCIICLAVRRLNSEFRKSVREFCLILSAAAYPSENRWFRSFSILSFLYEPRELVPSPYLQACCEDRLVRLYVPTGSPGI